MQKTWVEIDPSALCGNLREIQAEIGSERKIILVVKTDGYGHGALVVAAIAAKEGICRFAVATVAEGIGLRKGGIDDEILLLHPVFDFELPDVVEWKLTPTISTEDAASAYNELIEGRSCPVHIEINTGINRLGIDHADAADVITRIAALPNLTIGGIFTHFRSHFRGGLSADENSISQQMRQFDQVTNDLRTRGIDYGIRHTASSYPLMTSPETYCDAVRVGLIAYGGISGSGKCDEPLAGIKPVMSVRTLIMLIRDVDAGEWIHYGSTYQADRSMRVAVLPIGYGMGYPHRLSNRASVLINGFRAPVVGVVGMDMTIVDLDGIGDVANGDIATVLGCDGSDSITVGDLAEWAGTIPYEITCALGNGLPRRVINETDATSAQRTTKHATVS